MIDYILVSQKTSPQSLDAQLERVVNSPGLLPFCDDSIAFVAALSRRILTDMSFREFPELMAMAHWFRPANLNQMRKDFLSRQSGSSLLVRRGVVFHLAPSNVDSIFIYSWLISLLCGNSNIARVSKRRSEQMKVFFAIAAELLADERFVRLAQASLVLSYDHDAAITEKISALCHLRVIWGGDATVKQIRSVQLPPLATELAFANRFSLSAFHSGAILGLDEDALTALVQKFFNDVFWFNQQACSSPRAVIWIGSPEVRFDARHRFWTALQTLVDARRPENLPAQMMDRVTTLFRMAHNHPNSRIASPLGAMPSRILIPELVEEDRSCHDGNGLLLELERSELAEITPLLTSRDQTITYFGFDRNDWEQLIGFFPPHSADRIVPVGEALNFGTVWDGVDLFHAFTREIQLSGRQHISSASPE